MSDSGIKVVALNGSARKGGNTAILLRYVLKEIEKEGIETELIELSGAKIHGCLSCRKCSAKKDHRCTQTDDMGNMLIEKMEHADGILLGSPTYVADVSPEIKALMDRACLVSKANGGMFRRKVGAAVVAVRRAGAIHAFDALNHFFLISEMIVPGSSYWNIGYGREIGDVEKDDEGIQTMKTLGQNMAWLLKAVHNASRT
jgi:multimeric flavodoxin WrbA